MNGERPKIEIFEPFGSAYELMKIILFQPFDLAKWCVIGFAAFLSGAGRNHFGFNFRIWRPGAWNFQSATHNNLSNLSTTGESAPAWMVPLIIAIGLVILVLVLFFIWLSARGRFIFVDCVVKNRAAIVAPWREFRREGNTFFLFMLLLAFLSLLMLVALALAIVVPLGWFSGDKHSSGFGTMAVFAIVFIGLLWFGFAVFFAVVTNFMIPVMYIRRCRAIEACRDVSKLLLNRPWPFILFVLFGFVLVLALAICGLLVACLTCCIGALPYISTVLLLPAIVWLLGFKLLFFRQFGPEYDVWAGVALPEAPAPAPPAPPMPPPIV